MKTKNLIKAIEKTGLKIENSGNWYTVKGPRNYGKFCDQSGNAVCVSTCDNDDQSDAMTDYFPQWYHETIKSFIADLTKPAREVAAAAPVAATNANNLTNKGGKMKRYDISTYSEDFATSTEITDLQTGKIVDRLYIGSTDWDLRRDYWAAELDKFCQKYEALNAEQGE